MEPRSRRNCWVERKSGHESRFAAVRGDGRRLRRWCGPRGRRLLPRRPREPGCRCLSSPTRESGFTTFRRRRLAFSCRRSKLSPGYQNLDFSAGLRAPGSSPRCPEALCEEAEETRRFLLLTKSFYKCAFLEIFTDFEVLSTSSHPFSCPWSLSSSAINISTIEADQG